MESINAAVWNVKNYIETQHQLQTNMTIAGNSVSMANFLMIEIADLQNIHAGLYQSVILQNYTVSGISESAISGTLSCANYMNSASNTVYYYGVDGSSALGSESCQLLNPQTGQYNGDLRFESMVYLYAQVLNYYNVKDELPSYIWVDPWSTVTNSNTNRYLTDWVVSLAK